MNGCLAAVAFDALGTTVRVEASADIATAEHEVRDVIAEVDRACSRFRDDSELAAVNRVGGHHVQLGPLLARTLRTAVGAAVRTGGAVDPTIGAAVRAVGYDVSFDLAPAQRPPVVRVESTPGWRTVELDEFDVLVVPAGVLLDLGATAKAFAADLAAHRAATSSNGGVLVSIGGDIAVAGPAPADGWIVGVADSHRTPFGAADELVALWDGGLATSSTTVRRWCAGGIVQHHIVDPSTGRPACSGWRTVTVAAADCVEANTLATWAVIEGPGAIAGAGCPFRAVADDGVVTVGNGWPEPTCG